jgi:hypothetical protein
LPKEIKKNFFSQNINNQRTKCLRRLVNLVNKNMCPSKSPFFKLASSSRITNIPRGQLMQQSCTLIELNLNISRVKLSDFTYQIHHHPFSLRKAKKIPLDIIKTIILNVLKRLKRQYRLCFALHDPYLSQDICQIK